MKKLLNASLTYFIFAMIGGVFYREFIKYLGFNGKTTLSLLHVHLLVLGTLLFLLLTIMNKISDMKLEQENTFKKFYILHNIALPFMMIMLTIRGVVQVLAIDLSSAQNAMISGFAGISHILITISIVMMFSSLKKTFI